MIAHDTAGAPASLLPPPLVLFLRFPPSPPSPRLGMAPPIRPARRCRQPGTAAMLARNAPAARAGLVAALASGLHVYHLACPAAHLIGGP